MGTALGEERLTVHGFEDRNMDHRPWLLEAQAMLKGLRLNTAIFVADMDEDPHFQNASVMRKAGFRSFAAVMFGLNEREAGFLLVGNRVPCEFRSGDDKTLDLVARQMSAVVLHARKLDNFQDRIEGLTKEYVEKVDRLLKAKEQEIMAI